jgi:hypothetical protein
MNASCNGCSVSPCAKPSIVVTARLPTPIASTMHDATHAPSSHTVQAELAPRSQPLFAPLTSSGPRSTSANVAFGSTRTERTTPLPVSAIGTVP